MRKRIGIVGHSEEGLALIPLLEANPDVEICAIVSDDLDLARSRLAGIEPGLEQRFEGQLSESPELLRGMTALVAVIDAEAGPVFQDFLTEAPERGIQVTTPLIAKMLYAFGRVDASRNPDLLHTLGEILESYNLTVDRSGLLSRILQIAVGATGADRGSLMLYDEKLGQLYVEVAIGIERELIPKIRVSPGQGISGLAFQSRQAILVHGKPDRAQFRIVRERDDVESASSAPLIHDERVLGVLNLSHARQQGAFDEEDLQFVEQLATLDAKIISRAQEYHGLLRDSAQLHSQQQVQEIMGTSDPLTRRLSRICQFIAHELENGICHLYLHDAEADSLQLHASSLPLDLLSSPLVIRSGVGLHGFSAGTREPVFMAESLNGRSACVAIYPLLAREELIGVLSMEGALSGGALQLIRDKIEASARALSEELSDALREFQMDRENTRMTAITEAASLMNVVRESAELHRRITTSAAMILEAEHAVLRLLDEATGLYQIRSYFGSAEAEGQTPLFNLEKALSMQSIEQRQSLRLIEIEERPDLAEYDADVNTALVQPISRGARIVGTLALLNRAACDTFSSDYFSQGDDKTLARFLEHARQALERVHECEAVRHHQRFDTLTGLPNAIHLRERLEQEVSRALPSGQALWVVHLEIGGLPQLLEGQRESEGDRLVVAIAQELQAELRDFDVLARTLPDGFDILIPDPPADEPSALLGPLARRVREAIRREPDPGLAGQISLHFGYAQFPRDGQTSRQLLEHARARTVTND